jgi:hypothetical protein
MRRTDRPRPPLPISQGRMAVWGCHPERRCHGPRPTGGMRMPSAAFVGRAVRCARPRSISGQGVPCPTKSGIADHRTVDGRAYRVGARHALPADSDGGSNGRANHTAPRTSDEQTHFHVSEGSLKEAFFMGFLVPRNDNPTPPSYFDGVLPPNSGGPEPHAWRKRTARTERFLIGPPVLGGRGGRDIP